MSLLVIFFNNQCASRIMKRLSKWRKIIVHEYDLSRPTSGLVGKEKVMRSLVVFVAGK